MVPITVQELFAIQMLIGKNFLLIEDLLPDIVSSFVVTRSLGRARNKVLWKDLVQKKNIELWPQPLLNLFGLSSFLDSYNLEMSRKLHLYVSIRLLFILVLILFFMRGPHIMRLTVISFERRLYLETSRLSLLTQVIN